MATATNSPLPAPETLISTAFAAMQRVSSVTITQTVKGVFRLFNNVNGKAQEFQQNNNSTAQWQASPNHDSDAYSAEIESFTASRHSKTRLVRIGRLSYVITQELDVPASTVPSVIPRGLWTASLEERPFLFPDETFGKLGEFGLQKNTAVIPSTLAVTGVEDRSGTAVVVLKIQNGLNDSGQDLLRGSYTETLVIALDSRLWLHWDRLRTYTDGATYGESLDFSDYNRPNAIARPLTNPSSAYAPIAGGNPELGTLAVRLCGRAGSISGNDCGNSRGLSGLALTLSSTTGLAVSRTTDASGIAVFEDVPVYLSLQLRIGCAAGAVGIPPGAINGAGRTTIDYAVC